MSSYLRLFRHFWLIEWSTSQASLSYFVFQKDLIYWFFLLFDHRQFQFFYWVRFASFFQEILRDRLRCLSSYVSSTIPSTGASFDFGAIADKMWLKGILRKHIKWIFFLSFWIGLRFYKWLMGWWCSASIVHFQTDVA